MTELIFLKFLLFDKKMISCSCKRKLERLVHFSVVLVQEIL